MFCEWKEVPEMYQMEGKPFTIFAKRSILDVWQGSQ